MPDGGSATTVIAPPTRATQSHALKLSTPPSISPARRSIWNTAPTAAVLGLCGDSVKSLEELRQRYIRLLTADIQDEGDRLADLVYASAAPGSPQGQYRTAASGSSKAELLENLRVAKVTAVPKRPRKVIFLFSGQGGQYSGMGAELYKTVPTFREAIDQCQALLVSWGFTEMLSFIQGVPDKPQGDSNLEAEHTAMFALEYGLARMWTTWGIQPDVVLGQR